MRELSREGGPWFSGHSSHWAFRNCTLYKCKFPALDGTNYGFRIDACRVIGMTFPEVTYDRRAGKAFNHLEHLRRDWNEIRGSEFADGTLPPTVAWCAEGSAFIGCKFVVGEAFEGKEDFEWRAFVAESAGESPRAVFDARPGARGRVRVLPGEAPDVPRVGEKLVPEIAYATRAVARNE